jgi:hypothetical protein
MSFDEVYKGYPQYSFGYAKPIIAIGTRYEPTDRDRYDYHKVTPYACGSRR